jgi:hypothetical protein
VNTGDAIAYLRPRLADWHNVAGLTVDGSESGFGPAIETAELHMGSDRWADDANDGEARTVLLAAGYARVLDRLATMISYSVDQPQLRVEQGDLYKRCAEVAKPYMDAATRFGFRAGNKVGFSHINAADMDAAARRHEAARARHSGHWSEFG